MATPSYNYTWPQGEDLDVSFLYKEGPDGSEVAVDLTGYHVRMDIVNSATSAVVFTFNTAEQADPDEIETQSDGTVIISVPRSLTLPGATTPEDGAVYTDMQTGVLVYNYDIFLRNPSNKQKKVYRGTITIEPSYTLWR